MGAPTKWTGVELADKTLGIIGLGRIGKLVAQRALAFGMKLVAYDPFVSPDRARQISVEMLSLDEVMERSDFITLHLAKTPETVGLINTAMFAKAKPSLRIVNVARGGIIDEGEPRQRPCGRGRSLERQSTFSTRNRQPSHPSSTCRTSWSRPAPPRGHPRPRHRTRPATRSRI